jgi:Dot/Icm secretion system protein IcmQ
MAEGFSRIKVAKELINILRELLATGDWNASLFLRAASKRMQNLLEEAQSLVDLTAPEQMQRALIKKAPPHSMVVYISLYQVSGTNLQNWQYALRLLSEHNVSRPTYRDESSVRALIATKTDIERHGYAIVYINEDDIYRFEEQPRDSLGHELLVLKEGVVKLENIAGFVHANKKRYAFTNGMLVDENERY